MNPWSIDRTVFSAGSFADEPDDLAYWLSRPPAERLAAIEFLRRQFYDHGKTEQEFRRFFEVAEREPR
jgi:hypothetical protein